MSSTKRAKFQMLCRQARDCRRCPQLRDRTAVLSDLNGDIEALVMFIAEAPGRHGADRTRIPFSGDSSGANLQKLLDSIDLAREEIFITNSALCHPHTATGANRKPTKKEIENCAGFLRAQIELVDPPIVVTLGAVALEAIKTIEYHNLSLKQAAARAVDWNRRVLIPFYHPSPQVIASHRRMNEQLADFRTLSRAVFQVRQQHV